LLAPTYKTLYVIDKSIFVGGRKLAPTYEDYEKMSEVALLAPTYKTLYVIDKSIFVGGRKLAPTYG